jgi:hypothetical protein
VIDRSAVDVLAGRMAVQQLGLPFGPQQDIGVVEVAQCCLRYQAIGGLPCLVNQSFSASVNQSFSKLYEGQDN